MSARKRYGALRKHSQRHARRRREEPDGSTRRRRNRGGPPRDIVFSGTIDEINRLFIENEWSDGLPIIPPTVERVEAFLEFTDLDPDEVLAVLLPDSRAATVWSVAVNGVMAGCRPEYMPSPWSR